MAVPIALGETDRPLDQAQIEQKLRPFAERVVGLQQTNELIARVNDIESLKNVRNLTELLRPKVGD